MDHRRTISRKVFVPPVWLLSLIVAAIVVGAAGLGWIVWDRYGDDDTPSAAASPTPEPEPSETTPEPTPEPTETESTPDPEPTPTEDPEPTPSAAADRTAGVSVLNNTSVAGLAARGAAAVEAKGWADVRTGNWRGSIAENTVYYPASLADEAETLAADLGITRILPVVAGMRTDRLTVVLSEPSSSFP